MRAACLKVELRALLFMSRMVYATGRHSGAVLFERLESDAFRTRAQVRNSGQLRMTTLRMVETKALRPVPVRDAS